MIAFNDMAERVMLEVTDSEESKAPADSCMVRIFNIAISASPGFVLGGATHLLLRSNLKRLEPNRMLRLAANGRTTSSTRMA